MEAFGWEVIEINGHDFKINDAFCKLQITKINTADTGR